MGLSVPVNIMFHGFDVTIYSTIPVPPLLAGGVNEIVACAFPHVAFTPVGAPGSVTGTTAFEALLADDVPIALTAITVNV